jgi:hypothetical protein
MSVGSKVCALPGCDELLTQPPGDPSPRKYCCGEHRIEARRLRQQTRPEPGEPTTSPSPVRPNPLRRTGLKRTALTLGTVAALGTVGLALGPSRAASPPPSEPTSIAAPQGVDPAAWTAQAKVALTSLDSQLQQLADAENALVALPEQQQETLASQAREVADRKVQVQRQRAMLNAALAAQSQLPSVQSDLRAVQQQLTSINNSIGERSTGTAEILNAQREALQRSSESMRAGSDALRETLNAATRLPLSVDQDTAITKQLVDRTFSLARTGNKPAPEQRPSDPGTKVVALPESRQRAANRPRSEVTTTAPPRAKRVKVTSTATEVSVKPATTRTTARKVQAAPANTTTTPRTQPLTPTQPVRATKPTTVTIDEVIRTATQLYKAYQDDKKRSSASSSHSGNQDCPPCP